ncbi:MAG TPA: hypothetical protein PKA38_00010 [Candidatus Levybacteria bacterium]|nr:hypothetical protein [Candidatus Levybacteria bacterium]
MITLTREEARLAISAAQGVFSDEDFISLLETNVDALRQKLEGTRFIKEEVDWTILGKTHFFFPIDWRELIEAIQSGEVKVI